MDLRNDADVIRSMIQHEDKLTVERTKWLLTLEGLLFSALAFAWEKSLLLVMLLSFLGLIASVFLGAYMTYATRAITELQKWWEKRITDNHYSGPPVIGLSDKEFTNFQKRVFPQRILPIVFGVAWGIILVLKGGTYVWFWIIAVIGFSAFAAAIKKGLEANDG